MFNAIFGNFLFSRAAPVEPEPQQSAAAAVEASTQTALTASISTQTCNSNNNEPHATAVQASTTKPEDWVIVDPALELSRVSASRSSTTEDKGCQGEEENLVEMCPETTQQPAIIQSEATTQSDAVVVDDQDDDDDDDVMLGSFFDKHACCDGMDDVKMAKSSVEEEQEEDIAQEFETSSMPVAKEPPTITVKEEETWLITPLPCLTSITSSQRSIVENGTLENLLIEHPSMSIFMSATQSASASSVRGNDEDEAIYEADYQAHRKLEQKQKQKQAAKKEELRQQIQAKKAAAAAAVVQPPKPTVAAPVAPQLERTQFGTKTFASVLKEKQVQEPVEEKVVAKPAESSPVKNVVVIVKSVAEKRKESDKSETVATKLSAGSSSESLSSAASTGVSPSHSTKAKKEKKSKKSASSSPANNKENMQVRTLLFSDYKKANLSSRGGVENTNKNQMKRHNKNALFSKSNVSSKKQRKYHNLQQPSFSSYSGSNQQF